MLMESHAKFCRPQKALWSFTAEKAPAVTSIIMLCFGAGLLCYFQQGLAEFSETSEETNKQTNNKHKIAPLFFINLTF